MSFFTKEFEVF